VDLLALLPHELHELTGDASLVRRDGEIVPDLRRHTLQLVLTTEVPRIERLQYTRARARLNPRPWHPVDRRGPPSRAPRPPRPSPCFLPRRGRAPPPVRGCRT